MLAFSPFFPSNWEWENNLTLISSSPTKFDDDSNNNNDNNNNRYMNDILKSKYEQSPLPPLFQAFDGENTTFHMMSKSHEAQQHFDRGGLGHQELINSCSIDRDERRNECSMLVKKLNHNTRERDRRKRMNAMYSSLRSLLPASIHQKEELSIPETISLVVDYVPKLQKEVQNLIDKKEEIASKISSLQGIRRKSREEEKGSRSTNASSSSSSVSVKKLGQREIVIHTSAYERVSLPQLLLLLENRGLSVLNVSCHHCFGGGAFTSIHLWIEESAYNTLCCEALKEELVGMFEKAAEDNRSTAVIVNKEETILNPTTLDPYPAPWTHMPEPFGFYLEQN